jgi:hypothetical protein
MPQPPHPIALEIVGGVVVVLLLAFTKTRRWLRARFKTFDFLPEYFEAMRPEFSNVFWGVGVGAGLPYLIYALYSQFAYPPSYVNWLAILGAVFLGGYYLWRSDHLRLQPAFEITRVIPQTWTDQNTGNHAMAYKFEVTNKSETTSILEVEAQLSEIVPTVENLEWLPVHLVHQHDRSVPRETTFNLHPGKPKIIDFVSAFERSNQFTVLHTVSDVNSQVVGIEPRRLRVTITGRDVPSLSQWFEVSFSSEGFFLCIMEFTSH